MAADQWAWGPALPSGRSRKTGCRVQSPTACPDRRLCNRQSVRKKNEGLAVWQKWTLSKTLRQLKRNWTRKNAIHEFSTIGEVLREDYKCVFVNEHENRQHNGRIFAQVRQLRAVFQRNIWSVSEKGDRDWEELSVLWLVQLFMAALFNSLKISCPFLNHAVRRKYLSVSIVIIKVASSTMYLRRSIKNNFRMVNSHKF